MSFEIRLKVRFADVDPAGIVFYPRYFEMLNAAVEDWFAALGMDFATMHQTHRIGVPTVKLDTEFKAPSHLGDEVTVSLTPTHLGRSSCAVTYRIVGENGERLTANGVLVCMDLDAQKSIPWPDDLRAGIQAALQS